MRQAGTHIMGRVTYQDMAGFWPTSSHPSAAPMNDIPKVVFSRTLQSADDPDRPRRHDRRDRRLKAEPGCSQNLLYRYIAQGRVEDDRPGISPRRLPRMPLSRPDTLRPDQQELLTTSACTEMNQHPLPPKERQSRTLDRPRQRPTSFRWVKPWRAAA
jgi:hypothetical protein